MRVNKQVSVASSPWSRGEIAFWSCVFCCENIACSQCGGSGAADAPSEMSGSVESILYNN